MPHGMCVFHAQLLAKQFLHVIFMKITNEHFSWNYLDLTS